MSDQSYADSGGVQIFHAGTAGDSLVPVYTFDSAAENISTLVSAANRYTVTAVSITTDVAITGTGELTFYRGKYPTHAAGFVVGVLSLPNLSRRQTLRATLSVDLLPGENITVRGSAGLTGGAVIIGWEGYPSKFGSTEPGESFPKSTGNNVINGEFTPDYGETVVVRSEPLIGQSE